MNDLQELEKSWKDERNLRPGQEPYFLYQLHGFKRAGVDAFDISLQLGIRLDQYHYGIRLVSDQQFFLKKLYGEALSNVEIENISNTCCDQIVQHIERQIDQIDRKKNTVNI